MKEKVAIITGGNSSEREVSLWSSTHVKELLDQQWEVDIYDIPSQLDSFISKKNEYKCVIPVIHGKGGENGAIQGLLETINMPYIYSGIGAHSTGLDKYLTKIIAEKNNIRTAPSQLLKHGDIYNFEKSVVVKPLNGGSTVGISIVHSKKELEEAIEKGFKYDDQLLIEDYIAGEEFTAGIIEFKGEIITLPIVQIIADTFFDFESKYVDGKMAKEICPAPISHELTQTIQTMAKTMHQAIGAKHATRSDFIVDKNGRVWFLEINTIPGMTQNSLLPKEIREAGLNECDVINDWIKSTQ